jgi:polysaccharide biosynthesis protein
LALTGSEEAPRLQPRLSLPGPWSRIKARALAAEHLLVQRLAGTVFLIRVASAMLAFGSQVLFARWMGSFQFGVYVYVWTWVLLLGQAIDLGLGTAAQRFIPEYRERGQLALLRGFVSGSRWIALGIAVAIAALAAGGVRLIEPWLDDYMIISLRSRDRWRPHSIWPSSSAVAAVHSLRATPARCLLPPMRATTISQRRSTEKSARSCGGSASDWASADA